MTLTKLQRHTAYIIMLEEINPFVRNDFWNSQKEYDFGFCHLINGVFGLTNSDSVNTIDNTLDYFPEVDKKLRRGSAYWNKEGWKQRKTLLQQCIIETN